MASIPNFAGTPTRGQAVLSLANSGTRAAPASGQVVFTPGASGALLQRITVTPNATTVAGTVIFYTVVAGVYYFLYELQLTVQTITTGIAASSQTIEAVSLPNLIPQGLPSGTTIYAVLSVAQTGIVVQAEGGSF